ncbi:hypothetical protein [Aequorivita antarctica]|uniref:hypothetical protein n=1 Tax=Aequorivita antarctica TaxID=153266 RepID=UPI00135B3559|nr:hypothetical protein [Aequorivita antarctica]
MKTNYPGLIPPAGFFLIFGAGLGAGLAGFAGVAGFFFGSVGIIKRFWLNNN